jgi:hypothetical protein
MSDKVVLSTDMMPERQRAEWWREHVCENLGKVKVEWLTDAPIQARIAVSRFAGNPVYELSGAPPCGLTRDSRNLARVSEGVVHLVLRLSGRACYRQAGREVVHSTGDLALSDTTLPCEVILPDSGGSVAWELPRGKLVGLLAAPSGSCVTHIAANHGIGALLLDYLHSLRNEADNIDLETQAKLQDHLCQLIALALGPSSDGRELGREAYRSARLRRALNHIEQHLADGDLSAGKVATQLGMSTRTLQRRRSPKVAGKRVGVHPRLMASHRRPS